MPDCLEKLEVELGRARRTSGGQDGRPTKLFRQGRARQWLGLPVSAGACVLGPSLIW